MDGAPIFAYHDTGSERVTPATAGTLEDYGMVGNGETVSLISPYASVEWLCTNRFDEDPVFARRIGGGYLDMSVRYGGRTVALKNLGDAQQEYVKDTNVLHTTVENDDLKVDVYDAMPWGRKYLGRRVVVTSKNEDRDVAIKVTSEQSHYPGLAEKSVYDRANDVTLYENKISSVAIAADRKARRGLYDLGTIEHDNTSTFDLVVAYGRDRNTAIQEAKRGQQLDMKAVIEQEATHWHDWLGDAKSYTHDVRRGLLAMKLLTYEETGAMVAAPTASFPAVPGGEDNWDYRFCWLRDGFLGAEAFDRAGKHKEAGAFYDWAFKLQGKNGHWAHPLYGIDGKAAKEEFSVHALQGPKGEKPIRFGNAAKDQLQLDSEGSILDGVLTHYKTSGDKAFLERHYTGIKKAANWIEKNWHRKENGIWEVRDDDNEGGDVWWRTGKSNWAYGKTMCYAGLQAAAEIADILGKDQQNATRWRSTADTVKEDVLQKVWSDDKGAYTQGYERDVIDISVLPMVFYGMVDAKDPRMVQTVEVMEKALLKRGGIARHEDADLPFYLPTLWLARYYTRAGDIDRADELIDTCREASTTLGLMAEHYDGVTGGQWGNFPQLFSHEEMVKASMELHGKK
ncbi:MAG: glycoside hydrolase family 15 protein [Methanopyri archaeon]|nr:glycoside hydrolase family 15 protein [Methanopyri archaeon]